MRAGAALSISGFDAQRFSFLGFLPRKPGRHRKALEAALAREETVVLYESPYRVAATLEVIAALAPQRPVAVCRELTKKFEEILRGTAAAAAAESDGAQGNQRRVRRRHRPRRGTRGRGRVVNGSPQARRASAAAASSPARRLRCSASP